MVEEFIDGTGLCKRYPPKCAHGLIGVYPSVFTSGWCGEYRCVRNSVDEYGLYEKYEE